MELSSDLQAMIATSLKQWRDSLVELGGRNKLLNYRATKSSTIEFVDVAPQQVFDAIQGGVYALGTEPKVVEDHTGGEADEESVAELESHIVDAFVEEFDTGSAAVLHLRRNRTEVDRCARNLRNAARRDFDERGITTLYVGFGMLRWTEANGDARRSPLILVPVELEAATSRERPKIVASDDDVVVNPVLALRLEGYGIALPNADDLVDTIATDGLDAALDAFEALDPENAWTVERTSVLATFMFAKEAMYRDLERNEQKVLAHPVVQALASGGRAGSKGAPFAFDPASEETIDQVAPPERRDLILDADASQRVAIEAAIDGRSFVLDGPPGTGKSQTIANIIGELIARGKTVLFVSEKAVALDVVRSRLAERGLGSFLFELHSHKTTRSAVAQALGAALDSHPVGPAVADPAMRDDAGALRLQLNDYAVAVNEQRRPLERSVHDVLGQLSVMRPLPEAPAPDLELDAIDRHFVRDVRGVGSSLASRWALAATFEQHPWRGVRQIGSVRFPLDDARAALAELDESLTPFQDIANVFGLELPRDREQVASLLAAWHDKGGVPVDLAWLAADDFGSIDAAVVSFEEASARYVALAMDADAAIGSGWRSVPVLDRLPAMDPALTSVVPTAGMVEADRLRSLGHHLRDRAARFRELDRRSSALARRLGIIDPDRVVHLAPMVAHAATLLQAPAAPSMWLDDAGFRETVAILDELDRLEALLAPLATTVSTTFAPSALDVDASGLLDRLAAAKGLARFSTRARSDRAQLRSIASSSVRAARDALPALADLQRLQIERGRVLEHARRALGVTIEVGDLQARNAVRGRLDAFTRLRAEALHDRGVAGQVLGSVDVRAMLARELEELESLRVATVFETSEPPLPEDAGEHSTPFPQVAAHLGRLADRFDEVISTIDEHALASTFDSTLERLRTRAEVDAEVTRLEREVGPLAEALVADVGSAESWSERSAALRAKLEWTRRMRAATRDHSSWGERAIAAVTSAPETMAEPVDAHARWRATLAELRRHFGAEGRDVATLVDDLDAADEWLTSLRQTIAEIDDVVAVGEALEAATRQGLQHVVQRAMLLGLPSDDVADYLVKSVLDAWLQRVQGADARLRLPIGRSHDDVVRQFQDADRSLIADSAARVIRSAAARRPSSQFGASAVIRREAQKKRKHMPVRDLIASTAEVVQAVHPCFMMSPLAVSQYLPSDIEFDVVIFDEASQVLPGDTINCIYRGTSLITAGDQQQLPPSTFFAQSNEDESDEENVASDFDSILDLMKGAGQFAGITLRWHYRSRHEALIAYSNDAFYKNNLITFPGAVADSDDLGVKFLPVRGQYRRSAGRDNPIEARYVAERVVHHFDTRPGQSLGVVAFSKTQAAAIEAAIEAIRLERRDLDEQFAEDRMSGFFVKSLEFVQGDERDVIIFSTGYGPDEHGIIYKNFGPLNRKGGQRRLNVAVTRAKRLVEMVSSMTAGDLPDSLGEGALHLRRYLAFAEHGISALAIELGPAGLDVESPFEESVVQTIRGWGYDVRPQVGVGSYRIDIGVKHPNKPGSFVLGVECDGAAYHSSRTARDRDRIRHDVLVGLGWRMHHIWGTDWYRKRGVEEERLRSAIQAAIEGRFDQEESRPGPRIEVEQRERPVRVELDWTTPYEVSDHDLDVWYEDLGTPAALAGLTRFVQRVAEDEAPLHFDDLKARVRDAAGVARIGSAIEANLRRAIQRSDALDLDAGFLVRLGQSVSTLRVPEEYASRSFDRVHDDELAFALVRMVGETRSVPEGELFQLVAQLLSTRVRQASQLRLRDIVVDLVAGGRLRRTEAGLVLGPAESGSVHRADTTEPRQEAAARREPLGSTDPASTTTQTVAAVEIVAALLASDRYRQRVDGLRHAIDDDAAIAVLMPLVDARGRLGHDALARAGAADAADLPGVLAQLRRVLNVDGYRVLSDDVDGETAVLNLSLLHDQFLQ